MEFVVVEFTLLFVAAVVLFLVSKSKRPKNFPPGPPTLPFLGNVHQLGIEPHKTFVEMGKQYGDIFSIYLGEYPAVILNNPQLIKEAYAQPVFSGRPTFLDIVKFRTGGVPRGIFVTHENIWMEQRRFVLKTLRDFGFGKKSMESILIEDVQELVETLKKSVNQPIQTQNMFSTAVINGLWTLLSGKRYSHNDPLILNLTQGLSATISQSKVLGMMCFFPIIIRAFRLFRWFSKNVQQRKETKNNILGFIKATIDEHLETFQEDTESRDFIDAYIKEMRNASSDSSMWGEEGLQNLKFTMFDLFIAGTETTSTTLTWEMLLMALHPEKQEKLYEEIKAVVGTSRIPTLADRPNMIYTEATIMEVLRFSTLVPTGFFQATLKDVDFHGFKIPKNTITISNTYNCMKDPNTWGDGDQFRPERFISEDGNSLIRHDGYIPFSTGKRMCLGDALAKDHLFLFTTALFQRFRVAENPNCPITRPIEYIPANVLFPKPAEIVLHDRESEYDDNSTG